MTFRELLTNYYQVHPEETVTVDGRNGIIANGLIYFNIESDNLETIQMEQAVLAYYLMENGYRHIAVPIKNMKEEWFTTYLNRKYLIYELPHRNTQRESAGRSLGMFHDIGSRYQFEPQSISSYGQWKKLWVEKVNVMEETLHTRREERTVDPVLLDIFPYIIGMCENAIQYLRETEETESRFTEADQGTISFFRFHDQLNREVLWPDQLGFDHPARDVAEYIRSLFLSDQSDMKLQEFIRDYQTVRPLSLFGWRLVYARLLFPVHMFDAMEQSLFKQSEDNNEVIEYIISRQGKYQSRLRNFYEKVGLDKEAAQLIEVDWL